MDLQHLGLAGMGILLAKGVLALFSVASIAIMVERAFALRKARLVEQRDYQSLKQALMMGQMDTVRACVAASPAPCAAALAAGLSHPGAPSEVVRDAIAQEVDMQNSILHTNLPILATVASTAPYVGLFGTVLGILSAFERIGATGETGAKAVATPISEALITTALGLGVAIPAVMAYNYFSGRVGDLGLHVENHALDLGARLPELRGVPGGEGYES